MHRRSVTYLTDPNMSTQRLGKSRINKKYLNLALFLFPYLNNGTNYKPTVTTSLADHSKKDKMILPK